MNSEPHVIYPSWNLISPAIPQRSHLYHLEPVGLGTGSLECLTSYASRLAAAHCLSPAVLLARALVPVIGKQYWLRSQGGSTTRGSVLGYSLSHPAKVINGKGTIAMDWVTALETLTSRNDLRFLTMLPWTEVFAPRHLLRASKAWCPSCYEDRRIGNQDVYEPLLWTFREVEVCVKHRRRFNSQCQSCGHKLPWLTRSGQPGDCSKCGEWLGNTLSEVSTEAEISPSELEWQIWVTANLEEMISAAQHLSAPPKERIAESLTLCIDQACDGIMNRFAHSIDKRKTTVWGWKHGQTQIPINDLLRICNRVGISLVDFLYEEVFVLNEIESISVPSLGSGVKAIRRPARQLDREATHKTLKTILKAPTPLSMRATAERLEINKRLLYRHFPKLCKAISARYKQHEQAYRHDRQSQLQKQISETKTQLRAIGIFPSRRRVARIVRSQKLLRNTIDESLNPDLQIAA